MPEPIPTPAPPVTRYAIHLGLRGSPLSHCVSPEVVDDGEWCKWSDVQALLLQRAQEKWFPIQLERGAVAHPRRVTWQTAELAYSVYAAKHGTTQSLERMAERGGFYPSEMDECLPGWRERESQLTAQAQEIAQVQVELAQWRAIAFHCAPSNARALEAARVSRAPQPEQD